MNITQFSIERNRVVLSLLFVVLILGMVLYQSLSRDSMPPYTIRVASIVTSFPGASPERVEALVTDKIEKIAQELPELKKITSTSRTGISIVQVELHMDVAPDELQSVWDRLRRSISEIADLPENVAPRLKDSGIGDVFGIAVGITNDGHTYQELKSYADEIKDELIKLSDAAKVELNGDQQEQVYVKFDEAKLKSYGLTSSILYNLITSINILNPGGKINVEGQQIILEPSGSFNNVEDIGNILIPIGENGQVVSLNDVTDISRGYVDPPSQMTRINAKEAISLHVSLKDGANIIQLGTEVDEVIDRWQDELPIGMDLFRISSIDHYINLKVDDFTTNLIQAIAIVMAVMLIFLGIRTGLIIASLIPIVTLTTLMIMGLIEVGVNQISLAALIMALGMMVDNGIVVAESIMVKMESGVDVKKAAIESCSELFVPLLISTLTTSAAFLSFFMAKSVMGDIMGPIFVVITIALLSSWIISLTVITLFCVFFLKVTKAEHKKPRLLDRIILGLKAQYSRLMLWSLSRKGVVLVSILGLLFLSFYGFTWLSFVFFPDSDRNMITLDINLPEGTSIESTIETVRGIEDFITKELIVSEKRSRGIDNWSAYIGEGPSSYDLGYAADEANSNYAHILINTSSFEANSEIIEVLDRFCFNTFPNADIKVSKLSGGGGGTPIEIRVSGKSSDKLSEIAQEIKARLFAINGTKNIKDDWGPKGKKFTIKIDQNRAQFAGITNQDIAISLQTFLDGFKAGEFREGDQSIPIIMMGDQNEEQSLAALESVIVFAQNSGKSVPLAQVAEVVPEWQYTKIKRYDLTRTINITSQVNEGGNAAEIVGEISPWLDEQKAAWGSGYDFSLGGDAEQTAENMGAVGKFLPLSAFIIFILLIIQFNSFRKMLMIVCTIPLGIIGMVLGLLIFGVPFGFMAFLGVISLAGIVINNAIVLIDRIEIEESEMKRSLQDAIVGACLQRFRPILLATFTTVLGLVPLYLGGGEIWRPMAVTIMVGLLFGTVITLVFIPSFYSLLYKVDFRSYRMDTSLLD